MPWDCHLASNLWRSQTPSLLLVSAHRCQSAALREHCGFTDMFLIKFNKFFFRLVRCNRCAASEANGGEGAICIASMRKEGSASVCHKGLYLSYSFSLQLVVVLVCEMHGVVARSGSPDFSIRRLGTYGTKRFVRRSTLMVIACGFHVVSVGRPSRFQRR